MSTSLTHRQIVDILGDIDTDKVTAILKTEATEKDLEEVRLWLAGEDDVMGELERPLTGAAAEVFDILSAEEEAEDER